MKPFLYPLISTLFLFCGQTLAQYDIPIARFDTESLSRWQSKSFLGKTQYQIVELDRQRVLKAISHQSASGLVKAFKIDLLKTPYLNWSWRIENTLTGTE